MHSPDITQQNIDKLLDLFPNCKTEKQDDNGDIEVGIDFDLLKQELSKTIVEGPKERYLCLQLVDFLPHLFVQTVEDTHL
jgi:adenine-specific DNA-methyltransferase